MKIIGLLLIFLSSLGLGFSKAEEYREKDRQINAFIELLYFIRHEIFVYQTPQCKIYDKFQNKYFSEIGFLDILRKKAHDGVGTPLFYSVKELDPIKCDAEVEEVLLDFASGLGTLSVGEECERCDRAVGKLEEIYRKQKEETKEKTRLCRSVGGMVGAGLVLLLW